MNVLNSGNTSHTLKVIPRNYDFVSFDFILYNKDKRVEETIVKSFSVVNGVLEISFNYVFLYNANYSFKLVSGDYVIYRGKLFITSQNTQEYKIFQV